VVRRGSGLRAPGLRSYERRRVQHALEALVDDGLPVGLRLRAAGDLRRASQLPADGRHGPPGVRATRVDAWTDDAHVADVRALYARKRETILPALEAGGLRLAGSAATFYLWLDVGGPSEPFARRLLEHGIVCAPGSFFGAAGEGYVRFALVPTQAECERAAAILREVL